MKEEISTVKSYFVLKRNDEDEEFDIKFKMRAFLS